MKTYLSRRLVFLLMHVETAHDNTLHVYKLHSDAEHRLSGTWEITAKMAADGECQITAVPCPLS